MVQKIVCVGSINLDCYSKKGIISTYLGGSATNTAYYLAELCDPTLFSISLAGLVGNDANGQQIRNLLSQTHINQELIGESAGPSGNTQITLDQNNERTITRSSSVSGKLPDYLKSLDFYKKLPPDLIHVKANFDVLKQLFRMNNTILSVDISGFINDFDSLKFQMETFSWMKNRQIQILFGNAEEFSILAYKLGLKDRGMEFSLANPIESVNLIRELQSIYHANVVCVKMGAHGAAIFSHTIYFHIPTFSVKVEDTTGAGDAFNAGFLYQYLLQAPLHLCGLFACTLGTLKCTVFGPQSLKSPLSIIKKFLPS